MPTPTLSELIWIFLKLGLIGFGGPAAHVALMQAELVQKRQWLRNDEFLDLYSATNFIPGPNSTELAIHLGYKFAGFRGLILCGMAFILPAFLIVSAVAWVYVQYGFLPAAQGILFGVKPVVVAVICQAIWNLGKTALKNRLHVVLAGVAFVAALAGLNEIVILMAAVLVACVWVLRSRGSPKFGAWMPAGAGVMSVASVSGMAANLDLNSIFLIFLKIGSVLFGSGYVLISFLRTDLVQNLHWITESQLLDAVAVGQMTPGPVFTTATFIGYLLSGGPGAVAATVGIFLPAFVFVALSAPFLPRLRKSVLSAKILDFVNVASLAVMASATVYLAKGALVDWLSVALTIVSVICLVRFRLASHWLILGGALLGFLVR